ncbi:ABC transporter permease [Candidatus Woesearchaeota archaeon]|nr:ABC transporter permease [Candidatus Woesearchaeota archaeon]
MFTLFKIISKNFKLLTRSKASSLIVIFGPLLLIFLVGVAFDTTNTYNINIGIYSEQFNNVTDSFIDKLNENNFKVHKYDNEGSCVEHIKSGRIHTCVVFPPNMEFKTGVTNEIIFHIDYSKINLVWMILDTMQAQISATKTEISEELTDIILTKLYDTQEKLTAKKAALTDLKAKTREVKDSMTKIKEDLEKLDLSANKQDFKIEELTAGNDEIRAGVYSLKNDTENRIEDIRDDLDRISTKVDGLGNITDSVDAKIELIEGNLGGINYKLNTTMNITDENWQNMSDNIFFLENTVNGVMANLDSAVRTRSLSSSTISNMNQVLEEALNALNAIELTFDSIDSEIRSIQVTSAEDIVNPITTTIKPVSQEKTQLNYLFPSLMVLVIMFISILLSTTIIMMEKHSPAHFRNFITPIKDITFVLGTYATSMVLVIAQLIIILIVSSIFFKTQIISNLPVISGLLLLVTSLFTFLGMVMGYLFDSEETATLAAVSIGTILMLLSSTILPLETMPEYVGQAAQYNPFVISTDMLRRAILFAPPLETFKEGLILLGSYTIGLFLITWLLQKNYKRNYLHKISLIEKKFLKKKKKKKK